MLALLIAIIMATFSQTYEGRTLDDIKAGPYYDSAKEILYDQYKEGGITEESLGA